MAVPTKSMKTGYAKADWIFRFRATCCSMWSAYRSMTSSRVPASSPARIIVTKVWEKNCGNSAMLSASDFPVRILSFIWDRHCLSCSLAHCSPRYFNALSTGKPAFMRVASCLMTAAILEEETFCGPICMLCNFSMIFLGPEFSLKEEVPVWDCF